MKWLLSNADFRIACQDGNDWMLDILWENGIICEQDAITQFIMSSTEYDVPDCPFCGANDNRHYVLNDNRWKCKKCLKKFSLTSGRYIDNTKLPITHWWRLCWWVGNIKISNSYVIAKDLEVTQDTAWHMIKTLKEAYKKSGNIMVNGSMEIDGYWNAAKLLMTPVNKTV